MTAAAGVSAVAGVVALAGAGATTSAFSSDGAFSASVSVVFFSEHEVVARTIRPAAMLNMYFIFIGLYIIDHLFYSVPLHHKHPKVQHQLPLRVTRN